MTLDYCKVWKEPNGHLIFTVFPSNQKSPSETEEQCIERLTLHLKQKNPYISSLEEFTMKRSEFPNHPIKEKWRVGNDKKIYVDETIETDSEKKLKSRQQAINKLKSLGLTQEEIEAL